MRKITPEIKWTIIIAFLLFVFLLICDIILKPKLVDLIITLHGLLFDIIVLGIIIAIVNHNHKLRVENINSEISKRNLITQYRNEISDFQKWKSDESKYKIIGNIKRLNDSGESGFKLMNIDLSDLNLSNLDFSNSTLSNINFNNCIINNSKFNNCKISSCSFENSQLYESDFSNSKISDSSFNNSTIFFLNLTNSQLYGFKYTVNNIGIKDIKNASITFFDLEQITKGMLEVKGSIVEVLPSHFSNIFYSDVKISQTKILVDQINYFKNDKSISQEKYLIFDEKAIDLEQTKTYNTYSEFMPILNTSNLIPELFFENIIITRPES